ncbi:hypothetical protein BJ912DRAFT_898313 [Pholiota molesta]|nr:hypothetical protein BJ912DRAFT_898313 [Pholiota molesta]
MTPNYDPSAAYPASPAYPYARTSPAASSYGSTLTLQLPHARAPTLATLPAHILLQIIHHTFPYSTPQAPAYNPAASAADATYYAAYTAHYHPDTVAERQRRTLLWLSTSLRRVSRTLYTACMHVLRSTYLPAYLALVRAPYTSDPFPMGAPDAPPSTAASTAPPSPPAYAPLGRETPILDRFILLKIRHDVLADESSLHLDREDAFRDLFEVAQPRARLEDLVREIGARRGVVCTPPAPASPPPASPPPASQRRSPPASASNYVFNDDSDEKAGSPTSPSSPLPSPPPPQYSQIQPLPFGTLSISFQPRRIGLLLGRTRTIAEVPRAPGRRETLEVLAARLVVALEKELRGT